MTLLTLTGSQTVGPYYSICLGREDRPESLKNVLVNGQTSGERIRIQGHVLDGDRVAVPDALIEIWQANAHGRYHHPADTRANTALEAAFTGFGRADTDEEGRFWFETIKPGRVPGPDGHMQAPHIVVTVFARGLLNHAVTRLYFADEPSTDQDPVLQRVPVERRPALVAQPHSRGHERVYQFDIVLQGEDETPFFNL